MHPLYGAYAVERKTGQEVKFLTSKHEPERKGGKPLTLDNYVIDIAKKRRPVQKVARGNDDRSEEDFLSLDY